MSKRAEELAKQLYPDPKLESYDDILVYRADRDNAIMGRVNVVRVYEQAEKDIITIIESRIAEILGDAQPKPTIRIELKELITRIKEANEMKTQELTWQDVQRIVKIADDLIPCTPFVSVSEQIFADEFQTEQSYYDEILKRFKEAKSCGSH